MKTISSHLPPTQARVQENTAPAVNAENQRQARDHLLKFAGASPSAIAGRIRELEREWDIERTLEANAAAVSLVSLGLGVWLTPWWFILTGVVAAFLLQHALQGWCPPLPLFRRLQIRTSSEIYEEITALRVLRGDFTPTADPQSALAQVRRADPSQPH